MMSLEELSKAKWVTKGQLFEKILELEKLLFSTVVMFSSDRRLLGRFMGPTMAGTVSGRVESELTVSVLDFHGHFPSTLPTLGHIVTCLFGSPF